MRHAPVALLLITFLLVVTHEPTQAAPPTLPQLTKAQQKYVDKLAPTARKKFSKEAAHASATEKELLARWFPELAEVVGEPGQADLPTDYTPSKLLVKLAKIQDDLAADARKAEMPSTAGWEAYRALKLDPSNKDAAGLLDYEKFPKRDYYVHTREAKLAEQGKHLWNWGWTTQMPQPLDRDVKPTGDEGDEAHATWPKARELEYTFVKLRSNLPLEQACEIGQRVDALLETMRARYCLVEGYSEPAWPLNVWVVATSDEYNQIWNERKEQPGSPFGEYSYLHRVAHVNAETCAQGFEKTVGIAQHESCHAFFHACFKGSFDRGQNTPYGWMMEAVPAAVYYVTPQQPGDGQLAKQLKRKFLTQDGSIDPVVQSVLDGEDHLARLNAFKTYEESIGDLQGYITGALFTAMCWQDDRLRDAYARFTARCMAWKADKDEFKETFGETAEVTVQLKDWLK